MPVTTATINKVPVISAEFFNKLKEIISVTKVKSAVPIGSGLEVTFKDEKALRDFVLKAPTEWEVTSTLSGDILITVTPKFGDGHAQVPDKAFWAAVSRWGEVKKGRRLFHKDCPEIENGVRQFLISPKQDVVIPGSIRFGTSTFGVRYPNQKRVCHRCKEEGHEVKDCSKEWCNKCQNVGHKRDSCPTTSMTCDICKKQGHGYRQCPDSYTQKLRRSRLGWESPQTPEDEEKGEAEPSVKNVPKKPTPARQLVDYSDLSGSEKSESRARKAEEPVAEKMDTSNTNSNKRSAGEEDDNKSSNKRRAEDSSTSISVTPVSVGTDKGEHSLSQVIDQTQLPHQVAPPPWAQKDQLSQDLFPSGDSSPSQFTQESMSPAQFDQHLTFSQAENLSIP